ncbi:MAG: GNAT family N-acetyltransferase [Defluviitaleaceae bacterium]|nr:GNAT family N-acetyltransferase [Defluviitaleaceae bacterium]
MTYKNITLRPMRQSDLADEERWHSVETEWLNWDAPWEDDIPVDVHMAQQRMYLERLQTNPPKVYSALKIDDENGRHIGGVNRYFIDTMPHLLAVGIGIPPADARGKGHAANALILWIHYHFANSYADEIYCQTWSGNLPMMGLAQKIGMEEIGRIRGIRRVGGKRYDDLTFSVTKEEFYKMHPDVLAAGMEG